MSSRLLTIVKVINTWNMHAQSFIFDTKEQRSLKAHFPPGNDPGENGFKVLAFGPMILEPLSKHIKRAARLLLASFSADFQHLPAMELKILFITVLFLGASAAFSLQEEQEGKRAKLMH